MSETPHKSAKGLLHAVFARATRVGLFLMLALLLAVVVEWIGMTFFWQQMGVDHSRAMVASEIEALDLAVTEDALAGSVVHQLAVEFVSQGYALLAQRSGLERGIGAAVDWTNSPRVFAYGESALNSIQAFLLRVVVVALALPAFFVVAIMCAVDGLSRRALRRYGGGHESAYVFHHAKRVLAPSIFLPTVAYLSWPAPISPLAVFAPALLVFGVAITITVSKFKKFL